jgi:putative transposase
VIIDYSRAGKPTDNPYFESFNWKFLDECHSTNWFFHFEDTKEKIEAWKWDYNFFRPHSSLYYLSPLEFIIFHENNPETLI